MKLIASIVVMLFTTLFTQNILAGVYKCTDNQGNTSYQSSPCADANKALEIDIKTGGSTDLAIQLKQQEQNRTLKQLQQAEQQKLKEQIAQRKKDAIEQSAINQQLIKDNSVQFSAFSIPPYEPDNLPDFVKLHEARLPEIEKFRRLAAKKALSTGNCIRVEDDQLSVKSQTGKLVFSVDCSSAKTFFYNEAELLK